MAAGVDGADIFEAKVPLKFGFNKGGHKPATGSIHMNLHIIPLAAQRKCAS